MCGPEPGSSDSSAFEVLSTVFSDFSNQEMEIQISEESKNTDEDSHALKDLLLTR